MAAHYPDDLALQISCRDKAAIALHTLLDIVNNVLDMSKLESSAIDLEQRSFSLSATCRRSALSSNRRPLNSASGTKPPPKPPCQMSVSSAAPIICSASCATWPAMP